MYYTIYHVYCVYVYIYTHIYNIMTISILSTKPKTLHRSLAPPLLRSLGSQPIGAGFVPRGGTGRSDVKLLLRIINQ